MYPTARLSRAPANMASCTVLQLQPGECQALGMC